MRISHEAIYQALYVQGRGALRRELTACLRTGRALRVPRARTRRRDKAFVGPEIMISERPAEAEDRAVPGHWEGDLILGLGSSAIGTLVERSTRFTMLLHLPRMPEHGQPRVHNGPAPAGHGAQAVRDAIASSITTLAEQLRRSLTWDQGAEMAQHAQLRIDTGLAIYFCDPHSPWQRATNKNTNGLLRQGEFNWLLQRSMKRGCDGREETGRGPSWPAGDAVAGASAGGPVRASPAVLGGDRARAVERGRGARGGRVGRGRCPVVSGGWRDAVCDPASGVGAVLVVRRAGRDRDAARVRRWGAGDRASARQVAVDDLEGAAPERRDP